MKANHSFLKSFALHAKGGLRLTCLNLGATITGIWVPDRQGKLANVVLHYAIESDYLTDPYYLGCVVGRFANRIDGGRLPIGDDVYTLPINEPALDNHLHGGLRGFSKRLWKAEQEREETQQAITFTYVSPHLEEGYPGTLVATVRYCLTDSHELIVDYSARTDRATAVSLTNHSYFNLSAGQRDVRNHFLSVTASRYTPLNTRHLPTGERVAVTNSPFDLRQPQKVSAFVQAISNCQYCLAEDGEVQLAATLTDPDSGRRLSLSTSAPALQVYGGQYLHAPYVPFEGFCLEPQQYADAPNQPTFPTAVLEPGEVYRQTTRYQFDVV